MSSLTLLRMARTLSSMRILSEQGGSQLGESTDVHFSRKCISNGRHVYEIIGRLPQALRVCIRHLPWRPHRKTVGEQCDVVTTVIMMLLWCNHAHLALTDNMHRLTSICRRGCRLYFLTRNIALAIIGWVLDTQASGLVRRLSLSHVIQMLTIRVTNVVCHCFRSELAHPNTYSPLPGWAHTRRSVAHWQARDAAMVALCECGSTKILFRSWLLYRQILDVMSFIRLRQGWNLSRLILD